jgi:hypothetical protein
MLLDRDGIFVSFANTLPWIQHAEQKLWGATDGMFHFNIPSSKFDGCTTALVV